jgi:hypothetical protein
MVKKVEVAGHTYSRLTVLQDAEGQNLKRRHVVCQCACGNNVIVALNNLRNGHTRSCGCEKKSAWAETITKHCLSRAHPVEYGIWKGMKARCTNDHTAAYTLYGARGVVVDDSWADNFEQFLTDMGTRPSPQHTVERVDNDGPYSKENCIWATKQEQANNRRTNRTVVVFGAQMTLAEAVRRYAEPLGIKYATVLRRLDSGFDPEAALTSAVGSARKSRST